MLRCLRRLTSAASTNLFARGVTAPSNDHFFCDRGFVIVDRVNALKRKNFSRTTIGILSSSEGERA